LDEDDESVQPVVELAESLSVVALHQRKDVVP